MSGSANGNDSGVVDTIRQTLRRVKSWIARKLRRATEDEPDPGSKKPGDSGSSDRILTDTNELRPGYFTEFDDGLRIGAHPESLEQPVSLSVEWFDPAEDPDFDRDDVAGVDQFVEIAVEGVKEPWIGSPAGTGFVVTLPVPPDVNESHLYPLQFEYGEFVDCVEREDEWRRTNGIYDPERDLFVITLANLGNHEYPTRLGVVEHETRETRRTEPVFDRILEDVFGPSGARTDGGSLSIDVGFNVICDIDDCDDAEPILDRIEESLDEALPVYSGMNGSGLPELSWSLDSWFIPSEILFDYYLEDGCWGRGYYSRSDQKGVTCVSAAGSDWKNNPDLERVGLTTAHELFHAMQYGFGHTTRDRWLLESTARLCEDIDAPLEVSGIESVHPVDRPLDSDDTRLYIREYFFHDLFHRNDLSFEEMGDLFSIGLHKPHLEQFVENDTPAASLADADWEWTRAAAFEADLNPGGDYGEELRPEPSVFFDDWITLSVDQVDVVDEDDTAPTHTANLPNVQALSARLVEIELPPQDVDHYYQISFQNSTPRAARLYPDSDVPAVGADWGMRVYNNTTSGPMVVENAAASASRTAYLLVHGPVSMPPGVGQPPTVVVDGPYEHSSPAEDCLGLDPKLLELEQADDGWRIVQDSRWIRHFPEKDVAEEALKIIKHHKFSQACYVGRPNPPMTYWKSGDLPPSLDEENSSVDQDCLGVDPERVELKEVNGGWRVAQGSRSLLAFDDWEHAREAKEVIQHYGLSRVCYLDRPDPSLQYWFRDAAYDGA